MELICNCNPRGGATVSLSRVKARWPISFHSTTWIGFQIQEQIESGPPFGTQTLLLCNSISFYITLGSIFWFNFATLLPSLPRLQLTEKGAEINGYMEKHNIQIRGAPGSEQKKVNGLPAWDGAKTKEYLEILKGNNMSSS